jgi:hypothetical protein
MLISSEIKVSGIYRHSMFVRKFLGTKHILCDMCEKDKKIVTLIVILEYKN